MICCDFQICQMSNSLVKCPICEIVFIIDVDQKNLYEFKFYMRKLLINFKVITIVRSLKEEIGVSLTRAFKKISLYLLSHRLRHVNPFDLLEIQASEMEIVKYCCLLKRTSSVSFSFLSPF